MFKKIKELKLKIKIAIIALIVVFVSTVVFSIYSVIKLNLMENDFNERYMNLYKDYNGFKEELGKYELEDITEINNALKENLGINFILPDGIIYEETKASLNKYIEDQNKYTIKVNLNGMSYEEFGQHIYILVHDFVLDKNTDINSFKDGIGYYKPNSFKETTYGNIYFDVHYSQIGNGPENESFRNKIKLVKEEDNKVTIFINHW